MTPRKRNHRGSGPDSPGQGPSDITDALRALEEAKSLPEELRQRVLKLLSRPAESSLPKAAPESNEILDTYKPTLDHIEKHWQELLFYQPNDHGVHMGLPNPFISPDNQFFAGDQFYWDSYFIILGLVDSNRTPLAKGMVENFGYELGKYGLVPSRNRMYNIGISQPPFLTSMAREVFERSQDMEWIRTVARLAEQELDGYWNDPQHKVWNGLSRYCDHFITSVTAEHESGWDMTSRFADQCLDYAPVDLNSCLYRYESDLSDTYRLLADKPKADALRARAESRRKTIRESMWNPTEGFFFDYNTREQRQSPFLSIAGFYPLWAKLSTQEEAEQVRANLRHFEHVGGLANTANDRLLQPFRQHDYPNGWPQQQFIVIQGLLNYGFTEDARRLAKKWLDLNQKHFLKTGQMWEKYNVVDSDIGRAGRYPNQVGFGWTNGVFVRLTQLLSKL
jgi:alpha,alpha-trehalase